MHGLNNDLQGTKEIKEALKKYNELPRYSRKEILFDRVSLREILLSYDAAKNEKEQKEALERLYSCHYTHPGQFSKPSNMKKIKKEDVKGDSSSDEDEEMKKIPSKFNSKLLFNNFTLIYDLFEQNNSTAIHPVRIKTNLKSI